MSNFSAKQKKTRHTPRLFSVIPAKPVPDLIGERESFASIPRSADKRCGSALSGRREKYFRRANAAEVVVSIRKNLYRVHVSRIGSSAGRERECKGW